MMLRDVSTIGCALLHGGVNFRRRAGRLAKGAANEASEICQPRGKRCECFQMWCEIFSNETEGNGYLIDTTSKKGRPASVKKRPKVDICESLNRMRLDRAILTPEHMTV